MDEGIQLIAIVFFTLPLLILLDLQLEIKGIEPSGLARLSADVSSRIQH